MKSFSRKKAAAPRLVLAGELVFVLLYGAAVALYPGGSHVDPSSPGFSWLHNFWCNLMSTHAINGQPNPARGFALASLVVLSLSLCLFWFCFAQQPRLGPTYSNIIRICGGGATIVTLFLFTSYHDQVINLAGLLGAVAILGTFVGLHRLGWKRMVWLGWWNLLLVVLNNILYYGPGLLIYLPVVQKITFLSFLCWIGLICLRLMRQTRHGI